MFLLVVNHFFCRCFAAVVEGVFTDGVSTNNAIAKAAAAVRREFPALFADKGPFEGATDKVGNVYLVGGGFFSLSNQKNLPAAIRGCSVPAFQFSHE